VAVKIEAPAPRWRRLSPDERRRQILDAARRLFAERPLAEVSTGDVADAAGVARSLVHRYFGGVREVFLAVVADGAAAFTDVRDAGPETPFEERTAHNIAAGLDLIAANRETWLAVVVNSAGRPDPEIQAIVAAGKDRAVERTLRANADILDDTPTARFALRCFVELTNEAARAWMMGERTREETEALLITAGRDLVRHTIPALEGRA
jgi:AcrR family transcriptional regulator